MTPHALGVRGPAFQQAFPVLGLTLAHQVFPRIVSTKTALSPEGGVHGYHLGILAVADRAFEGRGRCCHGQADCQD